MGAVGCEGEETYADDRLDHLWGLDVEKERIA